MNDTSIRFGGCEVGDVFLFELTGGLLALDFVNTLDERRAVPKELLTSYSRLIQWSAQSGALSVETCSRLLRLAAHEPSKAKQALETARTLRELVFSILAALGKDDAPETEWLEHLNRWIITAGNHKSVTFKDGAFQWTYGEDTEDFEAMLWPVIDSIASTLCDRDIVDRIKLCEGSTCAWAFLDNSRQRNRRWCDMSVCGNRAKASRHRRKVREARVKP